MGEMYLQAKACWAWQAPSEARGENGDKFLGVSRRSSALPTLLSFDHSKLQEDKLLWLQLMKLIVF